MKCEAAFTMLAEVVCVCALLNETKNVVHISNDLI